MHNTNNKTLRFILSNYQASPLLGAFIFAARLSVYLSGICLTIGRKIFEADGKIPEDTCNWRCSYEVRRSKNEEERTRVLLMYMKSPNNRTISSSIITEARLLV